jgi:dTMP kinase
MLITLEGINGCGKTSQVQSIYKYFVENQIPVLMAKEPNSLGASIRRLLIELTNIHPITKLLIFQADRNENVHKNIIPALAEGKLVICDRFIDSTIAYQIYGNGIDPKLVLGLNKISSNGIMPDLTFWIDTSINKCNQRNLSRPDKSTRHNYTSEYLNKVREGYLEIARNSPERVIRIDGDRPISAVTREIIAIILSRTNLTASSN